MSFILPDGLRSFFGFDEQGRPFSRSGTPKRDTTLKFIRFDAYYCCLLLGLDTSQLGPEEGLEAAPFLNAYPENYKGQAELIAGLLVEAELRRLDIAQDHREDIEREMVRLLDLVSPTRLSEHGDKLLNRYAVTGFQRLQAGMLQPGNLEDFLVGYHGLWTEDGQADAP